MSQAEVTIPVPEAPGPSAWVPCTLVQILSLGLSATALAGDSAVLYGSNVNTIAVTAGTEIASFSGATALSDVGSLGFEIGVFKFYAMVRVNVASHGLTFKIVGNDGTTTITGAVTVTGSVTANPPLVASLQSIPDHTVTGVPGALPPCPAGPNGIALDTPIGNGAVIRFSSGVVSVTQGRQLIPGSSVVEPIDNAANLNAVTEDGSAQTLIVSPA